MVLLGAGSLIGITSIYQPVNVETQPQKPIVPPGQIQKQPPLLVQPKPPPTETQKQFASKDVLANRLTGIWKGQDQGIYYVRQVGDNIMWIGMSSDDGKTWTNIFAGKINGDVISGTWADVPRGKVRGSGTLTLEMSQVGAHLFIHKIGSTGSPFGTSTLDKTTCNAFSYAFGGSCNYWDRNIPTEQLPPPGGSPLQPPRP